jgi:hypothetical protein
MSHTSISEAERLKVEEMARKLGTEIPPSISMHLVWFPIVKKLLERIEKLEGGK